MLNFETILALWFKTTDPLVCTRFPQESILVPAASKFLGSCEIFKHPHVHMYSGPKIIDLNNEAWWIASSYFQRS